MADQQYCLRWNNHQNTLISVFDSLQERGCMVDCTLGAEGQSLQAHKVVLSACSPYLEDLLTKHYDKHPILILKDVRFEELKAMVDYMYRGEVNVAHDKLNLFLRAAESLQIKGLSDSGTDPPDTGGTAGGTKRTSKGAPVSVRSNQQLTVRSTNLADDSRDGSVSPSQRKRRRRRGSDESDNDSSSNVADGKQSSAAAAPVTGPSVLNQDLLPTVPASVPADALLSSIMESAETDTATDSGLYANAVTPSSQENVILDKGSSDVLVQPKTEYLDDDTQDLALGDDDSVAGPSHSRSGNFMNDTDMFMADQDGSNNAQGFYVYYTQPHANGLVVEAGAMDDEDPLQVVAKKNGLQRAPNLARRPSVSESDESLSEPDDVDDDDDADPSWRPTAPLPPTSSVSAPVDEPNAVDMASLPRRRGRPRLPRGRGRGRPRGARSRLNGKPAGHRRASGRPPKDPVKLAQAFQAFEALGGLELEHVKAPSPPGTPDTPRTAPAEADDGLSSGSGSEGRPEAKPRPKAKGVLSARAKRCNNRVESLQLSEGPTSRRFRCCRCREIVVGDAALIAHWGQRHAQFGDEPRAYELDDEVANKVLSNSKKGLAEYSVSGGWYCSVCGKVIRSLTRLKTHMYHHMEQAPRNYRCSMCPDVGFPEYTALYHHIKLKHGTSYRYACTVCDKTFELPSLLRMHSDKEHNTRAQMFHCPTCPRSFTLEGSRDWHRLSCAGRREEVAHGASAGSGVASDDGEAAAKEAEAEEAEADEAGAEEAGAEAAGVVEAGAVEAEAVEAGAVKAGAVEAGADAEAVAEATVNGDVSMEVVTVSP